MSNTTNIRISRSKYIERDRGIAILRLNLAQHLVGQPVMVRYYVDEEQTETDTLFAIGIKDGVGEDCYKVISLGGLNLVSDVVNELPDVSALTHGELYLYQDPEDKAWYYVYEVDNERQLEKITGGPYTFNNIKDKYRWFFNDGILRREDDFYSRDEIDSTLNDRFSAVIDRIEALEEEVKKHHDWLVEIDKEVFPLTVTFTNKTGTLFLTGTTQNITYNINVVRKGESVKNDCTYTINGSAIMIDDSGNYTKTGVTSTTTFNLVATYTELGITGTASNTVNFGYYFYYGAIPASGWTINETNVKALANRRLQIKQTTTFTTNLSLQKIAFACPSTYGAIAHIYDANSFDYINDYTRSSITVDGFDYYVYVKNSEVTVTNFRQQFTY